MENKDKPKCTACGADIDFVDLTLNNLNETVVDFLEFGSPADLLEEVAAILRAYFESDEITLSTDTTRKTDLELN